MVSKTAPARVPESDTLYTLEELRARLRIGSTKAHAMARTDGFPFPTLKLGKEYRFSRRQVEAWLAGEAPATDPTETA